MIETSFTLWLVLSIIAMVPGLALVAGLIPANRAPDLVPIRALLHEQAQRSMEDSHCG